MTTAHQRLPDQKSFVAERVQTAEVSPCAQAVFAYKQDTLWRCASYFDRNIKRDLECREVSIVDYDQGRTHGRGPKHLICVLNFYERIKPQFFFRDS